MALCPLQFCIGGGPLWHSVRYSFASEGAPFGTPSVTVLHRRGPLWHSVRYSFASEGAPFGTPSGLFGTCVRYSFASEGTPLALRPLRFCIGGDPFGTPRFLKLPDMSPPDDPFYPKAGQGLVDSKYSQIWSAFWQMDSCC